MCLLKLLPDLPQLLLCVGSGLLCCCSILLCLCQLLLQVCHPAPQPWQLSKPQARVSLDLQECRQHGHKTGQEISCQRQTVQVW